MSDGWSYFTYVAKVPSVNKLDEALNALGAEGWELVTSMSTVKSWVNFTGNDIVMVFKKSGAGQRPSAAAYQVITGVDPNEAVY